MLKTAEKVMIHPTANVEPTAVLGEGTRVWHRAHVRDGAIIGSGCTISKDVYVDTEVHVGNRVKIQNGVSVYKGVLLEDDVFVGPNVSFTNDSFPRAFNADWHVTPTLVRRGASIGANATVVCGVTLGPYSMVAAGSTVSNDVPPHGLVMGSPARLVGYMCRQGHRMRADGSLDYISQYRCDSCEETLKVSFELK